MKLFIDKFTEKQIAKESLNIVDDMDGVDSFLLLISEFEKKEKTTLTGTVTYNLLNTKKE